MPDSMDDLSVQELEQLYDEIDGKDISEEDIDAAIAELNRTAPET